MLNCSYCRVIPKISEAKGSRIQIMGILLSPLLIKQEIKFCDG